MEALLTSYNGRSCANCSTTHAEHGRMTTLTEADFLDVFGYDTARCEECKTVLFDGLAAGVR